ncbi:metal-dependent transcriptional regulator [Methanofollis fontis]|uniref:Metal-dependent transcriptional regulator n=1 Tax=Methanofollis fontis TaxID=2052832 RepID=A0A483CVJ3_9EURY|nr:metal-dependent transcriptional regulator [Methanofollis fontis]TAJ45527.1 metal-dependent transcriptional regulator [Methanofollis fontis]
MEEFDGSELPARRAEFLGIIAGMGGEGTTGAIAREAGVTPSTATKTLSVLADGGYIEQIPYRGVRLTPMGERYARFLVRRHRVLSLALSRFGLSPEEACREAKNLESHVSRELVDRICASLGHPMQSVCGPIEHDCLCCPLRS